MATVVITGSTKGIGRGSPMNSLVLAIMSLYPVEVKMT